MNYVLHLLIMIGIYLIQVYGLNLLVGYCGLLPLCQAVFYGIGAYACTLLMMNLHLPFSAAIVLGGCFTGVFALALAPAALRFRDDTFVIVSLGIQMIVFTILYNWVDLTRGPYGIPGIPRPRIFGHEISFLPEYLLLVAFVLVIVFICISIIHKSPFGLGLKALRDDEMAARGLGKSPQSMFIFAFAIAAVCGGLSGGLYATYVTYIDPTSFTLDESIFLITIILVGGSGNRIGPLLGTLFMILLPELLRFLGLPDAIAPNVRQIIYGLALIILMFLRPQGIAGEKIMVSGG